MGMTTVARYTGDTTTGTTATAWPIAPAVADVQTRVHAVYTTTVSNTDNSMVGMTVVACP